jgi:phosphate transport system protein
MCRLTEDMIDNSTSALLKMDKISAKNVVESDKRVDEYEMDIEKRCMRMLIKQQPVAKDFREVSSALKIITDIERIGDQARDISDIVVTFQEDHYFKKLEHLEKMGNLAVEMVHESINSFINNDENLADITIARDDDMDRLFIEVKDELIDYIKKDSSIADQAITFMMIAKYFERIGDHAVNICEWTKYNETGVHINLS